VKITEDDRPQIHVYAASMSLEWLLDAWIEWCGSNRGQALPQAFARAVDMGLGVMIEPGIKCDGIREAIEAIEGVRRVEYLAAEVPGLQACGLIYTGPQFDSGIQAP
jgi:hypothetical protein